MKEKVELVKALERSTADGVIEWGKSAMAGGLNATLGDYRVEILKPNESNMYAELAAGATASLANAAPITRAPRNDYRIVVYNSRGMLMFELGPSLFQSSDFERSPREVFQSLYKMASDKYGARENRAINAILSDLNRRKAR